MRINRPIVFLDTETTGTDIERDRVVEIAAIKINLDGTKEEKQFYINPMRPIPPEATAIHGITDDMVAAAPTFSQIARGFYLFTEGCDIGGYNSNRFDIPLLHEEFKRCQSLWPAPGTHYLDAYLLYLNLYPRTLERIYKDVTGKQLDGAHGALADTRASLEVFFELVTQLDPDMMPADIDDALQGDKKRVDMAGKLYRDKEGVARWNFGPKINEPILSDMGFFNWVMAKDFAQETKDQLLKILTDEKPI